MRENYQKGKAEKEKLKAEAIANGQEPQNEIKTVRRKNIACDDISKLFDELQRYFNSPNGEEDEYEEIDEPPPFIGPQESDEK